MALDARPISKLRRLCAEELAGTQDYYTKKWDGLDGFGNSMQDWDDFTDKIVTDMPAGLLEVEALAN
eukprot:8339267-Prorocentrum_lima.AAC.1